MRKGWKALLVPVMILLPMLWDFLFSETFFTARLGADGAKALSSCINDVNMGSTLGDYIASFNMSKWQLAIFFPLFTCFLGMFIPGSSQIAIFGVAIVGGLTTAGINPLLAAAVLPAITGAIEGMTPPLALSMYTAMGIAQSGMKETSRSAMLWVIFHLATSILIIGGLLPVLFI